MNIALAQTFRYYGGIPLGCTRAAPLTTFRRASSKMAAEKILDRVSVYKITCLVTGKAYIGITSRTVKQRWNEHVAASRRDPDSYFHRAIAVYGADNFLVETICIAFGRENACAIEIALIAEQSTLLPDGYNLSVGGQGAAPLGAAGRERLRELWNDPVFRARMLESFRDREVPESHKEHLRALAAGQRGKKRKAESVEKGRAALMGHPVSEETLAKMSAGRKGKGLWGEEQKKAHAERIRQSWKDGAHSKVDRSAAAKKRWANPEFREKFVSGMKGRTHTAEARAKISNARRGKPLSAEHKAAVSVALTGKKRYSYNVEHLRNLANSEGNLARLKKMNDARRDKQLLRDKDIAVVDTVIDLFSWGEYNIKKVKRDG